MFYRMTVILFSFAVLTSACDGKPPPSDDERTSLSKKKSKQKEGKEKVVTSSDPPTDTEATGSASSSSPASPDSPPTAVASASPTESPPPPPPVVPVIHVEDPPGLIYQTRWMSDYMHIDHDKIRRLDPAHPGNAPIMDVVIMHTAVLTPVDEDKELAILRDIQRAHVSRQGRGWGDISAHYLIGPSGKLYQGRKIWYRYPDSGSVGAGMGRFNYHWGKCSIMLLGDFNNPAQEFTPEAQETLVTLIEDRTRKFGRMYRRPLNEREAETRLLLGSAYVKGTELGLDEVGVRRHPSLPTPVWEFLLPHLEQVRTRFVFRGAQ